MKQAEFVKVYGEGSIEKAFAAYHNQRQRSKAWRSGSVKKAGAFDKVSEAANADPRLKELLTKHGITL